MKNPTQGYLKCYYGYKNFGDELLAFGVINRIFSDYPSIEKLYIEVGNKERFWSRLEKNQSYLTVDLCKLELIQKDEIGKIISKGLCNPGALKFLGGGEIFTEARGRFHGGRNYFILFWSDFLRKNVVILGGLGTPTRRWMKLLYKLTVNRCQKLILREKKSVEIASSYLGSDSSAIVHRPDFATDVVNLWQHRQIDNKMNKESQNTLLLNLTPYSQGSTDLDEISLSVHVWGHCLHVYFPCGQEDVDRLGQLKVISPGIEAYYRWFHDIDTTLTYMSTVSSAVGSRLHFVYVLFLLGVDVKPIVYQEKVQKFLEEYNIIKS